MTAATFARPAPAPPRPAPRRGPAFQLPAWLGNPFVAAGGAAGLLLVAATALILATANPHAGAPSIRVALDAGAPAGARIPGLRPGQTPDPLMGGVALNTLIPGQELAIPPAAAIGPGLAAAPAVNAPIGGEAVFVLPQGATMSGALMGGGGGSSFVASGPGVAAASPIVLPTPTAAVHRAGAAPLTRAPLAGLTAPGPNGLLPVVARDGRTPFAAYKRPFADNGRPKVALVVGGLGLNAAATKAAIDKLPGEITLSFVPYADNLQQWIDMARAAGHEVLLDIPMEPLDYPNNDPGPYTLMAQGQAGDTVKRLDWLLSRATGYFGVGNYLGGRFVTSPGAMATFASALKGRGLGFVDDGSAAGRGGGVPRASAVSVIDEQLTAEQIGRQLLALEAQALRRGQALGTGFAYPVTVDQVTRWAAGLAGRGCQLAPASAVTRKA